MTKGCLPAGEDFLSWHALRQISSMVAFSLLLYMGSSPEDRLRAATVIFVFFIWPRLFLFDLRSSLLFSDCCLFCSCLLAFFYFGLFHMLMAHQLSQHLC